MSTILPRHQKEPLSSLPVRTSAYHQDPLTHINRQAKYIQRQLQALIDAQSDGLLAGLGRPQSDGDVPSLGSQSPPPDLPHSPGSSTYPVRQPPTRRIGLRSARDGIFKSIYDLLKLREEEREILQFRADERSSVLRDVEDFHRKRAGLEEAISTIHSNRESRRSKELRKESDELETDIHELETRLSQMKARHRRVLQELSQIDNSVESRLSSYKASLSLLESNIQNFLRTPPVEPYPQNAEQAAFYSLNPKRRTLDMAGEQWRSEQSDLQDRQHGVSAEIQALEEGGGAWKQVIGEVSGFERRLRDTMRQSVQRQSQLLKPEGPSGSQSDVDHLRSILDDLKTTTDRVAHQLNIAEEKDWRLLVCCIGAELEALREARSLLIDAFGVSEDELASLDKRETQDDQGGKSHGSEPDPLGVDNPEPPKDLLKDTGAQCHEAMEKSDEDDEPDPAWLLPEA